MQDDDITRRFATALKHHREKKGLSRYALAKRSGIDLSAIGRLERGITSPLWRSAILLAQGLGVSVEEFR